MNQDDLGYRSLQDIIRTRLRDAVIKGDYKPGERLNINVLAKEFGVSGVPIREALRALEAEGFVDFSPNRGAVVKSFAIEDVREAFLIRLPLESVALRQAIPNLVPADFDKLERILVAMEKEPDPGRWLELNQEFHLSLYQRAGLPRLHQILTLLWTVTRPYLNMFILKKAARAKDELEHSNILKACRKGDVTRATQILERHLSDTRDVILTIMESSQNPPAA